MSQPERLSNISCIALVAKVWEPMSKHSLIAGCDCATHTYCANLPGIPEDEWYCHGCTEERERTNQGRLSAIIGLPGAPTPGSLPDEDTPLRLRSRQRTRADAPGSQGRSAPAAINTANPVIDLVTPEEATPVPRRPFRRLRR